MFQRQLLKLNNGLQIIWDHRPSYQSLAIYCIVKAGSINDPPDMQGLAHCVEHLILESSDHNELAPISHEILESGGYINATTGMISTDFTLYAHKEDALECLRALAKILCISPDKPDLLQREKTIIYEEMRLYGQDHPYNIQRVQCKLFGASESYQHATIGNLTHLNRITIQEIQSFHKRFYSGNNIILVLVGNLDPKLYQNEIKDVFSSISNRTQDSQTYNWKFLKGPRYQLLNYTADCSFYFYLRLPIENPEMLAALELLDSIFIENPHSTLHKRLRQTESLCYSVDGGWWILNDAAILSISGSTNPKNLQKAIRCVLEEGALLASGIITEEKLNKLKKQTIKNFLLELEGPAAAATWYAAHTFLGITNDVSEWIQLIQKVKAEEINKIARAIFSPDNIYSYIYGPMNFFQTWRIKRLFSTKNLQKMVSSYPG